MSEHQRDQAVRLEQYCDALNRHPAAAPPPDLDPALAALARHLQAQAQAATPATAFAAQLEQQLEAQLATPQLADPAAPLAEHHQPLPLTRRPVPRLIPRLATAAVAMLIVALTIVLVRGVLDRPLPPLHLADPTLSAIFRHAQQVFSDDTIKSYHVTVQVSNWRRLFGVVGSYDVNNPPMSKEVNKVITTTYQSPARWRMETSARVTIPDFSGFAPSTIEVSDGTSVWQYQPNGRTVTIYPMSLSQGIPSARPSLLNGTSGIYNTVDNLDFYPDAKLEGNDVVAGRPAYKINLVLSPLVPGSTTTAIPRYQTVIWLDRETYFPLKQETYNGDPRFGSNHDPVSTWEVTSIQYDPPTDPRLFTFTPTSDMQVADYRPQPAPSAAEFRSLIDDIARAQNYPIFLPTYLPANLVPRHPMPLNNYRLTLDYVTPSGAATPPPYPPDPGPHGLQIVQGAISYEVLGGVFSDASYKPTTIDGEQAWVRDIPPPTDSNIMVGPAITFFHRGTLIQIASNRYAVAELLKVAHSLTLAPGSKPPAASPSVTQLLRQTAAFTVLLPTYLPDGVTAEPPVVSINALTINYHRADGSLAFQLQSGHTGSGMDSINDYVTNGQPITLSNGQRAYYQPPQCTHGAHILYLAQDGTFVVLFASTLESGTPPIGRDELARIAASLSPTAKLTTTAPPPATRVAPVLPEPDATDITCPHQMPDAVSTPNP